MAGPDPAAMKKGEEMGKASSKPVFGWFRPKDLLKVPPEPPVETKNCPFGIAPGKGKVIKIGLIAGENTSANSSVKFRVKKGGTTLIEAELQNWIAGMMNILSSSETTVEEDEVFFVEVENATTTLLPTIYIFVQIELGG